jgi:hypothetical protein
MIILLTKDENKTLAIGALKEILSKEEHSEIVKNMFLQTGLYHKDLEYFLDIYVLEEGRKHGGNVSTISYESENK